MFFLVERDYYRGQYCCLKDTLIGIPPGIHQEAGRGSTDRLRLIFSPFTWDNTARGSGGFRRASSSEPILSAVDPFLYPTAIHGDFVQTTANPRTRTAMHRQDTPWGGSRTVLHSHLGTESRSFRLQTVPSRADVIPQHNAVSQSDSEAEGCRGTFQS